MELNFRENPHLFTNMIDAIADGVFTVDAIGNIVAWSSGAARITGYSSADVEGKSCHVLEGQNCKGFSKLREFLENPSPVPWAICNQECKVLGKDGRELYLFGNVSLIRDDQGHVEGAVGTFTDLTEFILNKQKLEVFEEQTKTPVNFEQLVGKSAIMQEVFRRLRLAAKSEVSILLAGESGTGKELAARAIHSLSCRKDHPFLAINCSAIPETLLESELFGHVKGSFTGAVRDKIGIFQAAEGGTLFLDEIGDTSPLLQLKLLRVLQENEIRRVGEEKNIKVNVRLITATNRVLKEQIKNGDIREDFYYRIRVFEIELPPLRDRRDDIPLLVNHFIAEGKKVHNREVTGINKDAMHRLMDYSWPGNVRELRNALEHAFVTVNDSLFTAFDLPPEIRNPQQSQPKGGAGPSVTGESALERQHILDALHQTGGHRGRAAKELGISRVTLWKKINQHGIPD